MDRVKFNNYERWVSEVAGSTITTAHHISDVIVSVSLALIAVVSAVPEFMGLWHTSGNFWLSLAVAATGAGVAHTAVKTKMNIAWTAFGVQLVIVETILAMQGGTAELAYPIVNVVGAAVMAIASEHRVTSQVEAEDAKADKEFEREQERLDREHKRQMAQKKLDAKLSNVGVKSSVKFDSVKSGDDSTNTKENRQSELLGVLHKLDTPSDINKSQLAEQFGVSRQTIINDFKELQSAGKLHVNGHVQVKT